MKKPICLITGATDGVGKVTALDLAKKGFTIVVAARNPNKAEALLKEIETSTGNTSCDYIVADLASLRQVRQLAETFRRRCSSLDVLLNNAVSFVHAHRNRGWLRDDIPGELPVSVFSSPTSCSTGCGRASRVGS